MGEKIVYLVLFIAITIYGIYNFKKQNKKVVKKEMVVYGVTMLINLILISALLMNIEIASPLYFLTTIFQPISDLVFQQILK